MARNSGVDILSIKPDADMGLGQDTNIPVPVVELDATNAANRDIRLYDHQRQIMKYDQDLKRQAKLLEGIANEQVAVGAIEPDDKAEFDRLEAEARKAFLSVKSTEPDANGQNKAYEDWKTKVQDLKDYAAAAQAKHVQLNKLRQTGSGLATDKEKAGFGEFFIKQQKKRPGEIIDPYVPPVYADFDALLEYQKGALLENGTPINKPATTTTNKVTVGPKGTTDQTTVTTKPATKASAAAAQSGVGAAVVRADGKLTTEYTEPDKEWSFDEMYKKANFDAATVKGMENQKRVWETFMGNPDSTPKKQLEEWNKQLAKYHTQKGIESIKIPGSPELTKDPITGEQSLNPAADIDTGEFPYQINYEVGKDGRIIMRDDPVALAAKIALANVDGEYVIKGKKGVNMDALEFNLKVDKYKADLMNDKGKLAVEWGRLGLDRDKFNATNKEDFASAASVINEATSIINKGEPVTVEGGGKTSSTIRISDPTLLNTFGNVDKNGTVTNVPDAINYDKEKNQAVLIYYDKEKAIAEKLGETKKTASGKNIVEKEIPIDQRTWLKHITKRSHPNKDIGNINTQVDVILEKNGNSLYSIAEKQKPQATKRITDYTPDIQSGIKAFMKANNLTEEAAIKLLKENKKID